MYIIDLIQPISPRRESKLVSLTLLAATLSVVLLEFAFSPIASQAESEASSESSSEAGLEAPANFRRRRRYRNHQKQTLESKKIQHELTQEAKERSRQLKSEQKQLSHGPQIRTYGNHQKKQGQAARQNGANNIQ